MAELAGVVIVFILGLSWGVLGAFNNVTSEELEQVANKCNSNSGLEKARFEVGVINIKCKDGARFKL